MFGLFCGRKPVPENNPADAQPKEDRGTLARLKGFLGLESGNSEESGEKSTEECPRRSNQQSKRGKGLNKKSKSKKKKQKRWTGAPENRGETVPVVEGEVHGSPSQSHSDATAKVLSAPDEEDTIHNCSTEEEDFVDCLSEELQLKVIEDEDVSSSCFTTPLSSPLPSRPASHLFLFESELELTSSAPSESGYNGSADDARSTSSEHTDCKELSHSCGNDSRTASDNEDDDGGKEEESSFELISSLPLSLLNLSIDSGISVSESALGTPLDTPGADSHAAAVFVETSDSLTTSRGQVSGQPAHGSDSTAHQLSDNTNTTPSMHVMEWSGTDTVQDEQQTDEQDADFESDDSMHNSLSHSPLQYEWSLYYDTLEGSNQQPKCHRHDYISHVNHVTTMNTIEGFWSLYNHIHSPAELANSSNCHFFKSHIKPMWEDPANKNGGKWVLTMKNQPELLNQVWLEMLLALIGDQFQKPGHTCGAVASRRKKADKIALWTRSKNRMHNIQVCKGIIQILLRVKQVPHSERRQFLKGLSQGASGMTLVFMHHYDALRSGSSYQNCARISVEECVEDLMKA